MGAGQAVSLTLGQTHYVQNVMRRGIGDTIFLFNGIDGEWFAEIAALGKRNGIAACKSQSRPQIKQGDLWLLFAPIKKARTDYIVEKATEMGCSRLQPVITQFTNADRTKLDRMTAQAIEAAEQSERLTIPAVCTPIALRKIMENWPAERVLIFADENAPSNMTSIPEGPAGILIGPEGGFSDEERDYLKQVTNCHPISLGSRILRAETAAVAALVLYQSTVGDWV